MRFKFYKVFWVFAFAKAILLFTSCDSKSSVEKEIAQIVVDVQLDQFHTTFSKATVEQLPELKQSYPQLFPQQYPDELWEAKIVGKDTIYAVLEDAVLKADFNYEAIENQVEDVMRHVNYYFPDFETTDIITVLSEVNYRKRVTPTKDYLIIGIDNYLGSDHELYTGINEYQRDDLNIDQLPADVALSYAYLFTQPSTDRTLLGSMVYFGKLQYLQSLFAPNITGAQQFETTPEKYDFMVQSENQMWRYFVDKSLLFSTDPKLLSRFILPAPFSKFYLEVDQQTPGGVGKFIGYNMVTAFMNNNEVSIEDMLRMPAQELFEQSGYKPQQ